MRSPYPRGAIWFPGSGTWDRIAGGHLVVGSGHRRLWRSRGTMTAAQLGVVAAAPAGVAFQHNHRLYVAPLGDAERPVARGELPLGWTTSGLYTYSYPRRELLLRAGSGAVLTTIARRPREYAYDLASRSVYFLTGEVVMRPDGSRFASTSVRDLDRISSLLAVAPGGGAVAFTGVTGVSTRPTAESVDLLRPGAHSAVVVHREVGSFGGCGQWAGIVWHGSWLLYSNTDGRLAAFDTAGARRTIELSGLLRGLLGARTGWEARWSW